MNSLLAKYSDKKILITGHTGFKGSWLTLWLKYLGANVTGISLDPPTNPSYFNSLNISDEIQGDQTAIQSSRCSERFSSTQRE